MSLWPCAVNVDNLSPCYMLRAGEGHSWQQCLVTLGLLCFVFCFSRLHGPVLVANMGVLVANIGVLVANMGCAAVLSCFSFVLSSINLVLFGFLMRAFVHFFFVYCLCALCLASLLCGFAC